MKRVIKSSTCGDMIKAFNKRIDQLKKQPVASTCVNCETEFYGDMTQEQVDRLNELEGLENPGPEYKYQIQECFGAPQAGCSFFNFEEWYEVEDFLDEFPVVQQDIEDGYALIKDL